MSFERKRHGVNLEPARYGESGGEQRFKSGFPWRALLGLALVLLGVIAAHSLITHRRVEGLRAEVMGRIDSEVRPVRSELEALRDRISALVLERYHADVFDSPFLAEGFDIDALREGPVLTLRLGRRGELEDDEVHLVVKHGAPDDIGSCIGVPNQPASKLYGGDDFLGDAFIERVRSARSELELRGLSDQLERRIVEVLPELREAGRTGRMILSIDRPGEELIEVSIVDLESGRDLMRLLARAEGRLLTATVALGEATARPRPRIERPAQMRGAVDCGVAIQMKALLDPESGPDGG